MIRLVFTNLDGLRHEVSNSDGLGRAFVVPVTGGVVQLTEDQYERAKAQLAVHTSRGVLTFTAQSSSEAWKARCASTGPLSLSGLSAIDGVTPVANDIVLVKNQADAKENGLYVAASGTWSRLLDIENQSVLAPGMLVTVLTGTANGDLVYILSSDAVELGVNDINFSPLNITSLSAVGGLTKTTAAMTLYVATTGLDTNDGLTLGTPLKTISAALRKIPFYVQPGHPVTINVAAGTYDEAITSPAFVLQDNITVAGAPMVLTAPAAGISSGTFDVSFGTQAFPHRAVVTGAGWTAGGLTGGYFVEVLDGPGIGQLFPVVNNGTDTIDVGFPCNTGTTYNLQGHTFQLVKPSTIFTQTTSTNPLVMLESPVNGQAVTTSTIQTSSYLNFSRIAFQRTTAYPTQYCLRAASGAYVATYNCSFLDAGSGGTSLVQLVGASSVGRFENCLYWRSALRTNTIHVSTGTGAQLTLSRCGFYGGLYGVSMSSGPCTISFSGFFYGQDIGFAIPNSTRAFLNNIGIDNAYGGGHVVEAGSLTLTNCTIKNCTTCGISVGIVSSTYATAGSWSGYFTLTNSTIDTCVRGIILGANTSCNITGTSSINNCTVAGVNMAPTLRSAHNVCVVAPTISMTGNTADFLVDGATPVTLAFLRAQSPKAVIDSNYFNRLVEV
jgi:hypothetical protein